MKENDIRQNIIFLTEQIWNIDEELRTILPYIGLPYERLPRTLQIIMASCGYNSISEWFNIISVAITQYPNGSISYRRNGTERIKN